MKTWGIPYLEVKTIKDVNSLLAQKVSFDTFLLLWQIKSVKIILIKYHLILLVVCRKWKLVNFLHTEAISRSLAEAYLKKIKELIKVGKCILVPRERDGKDFLEQLLELGITDEDVVWEEIESLTMDHYKGGPEADRDAISEEKTVLKFKKYIDDIPVYIKLKYEETESSVLVKGNTPRGCVCISFHKDETNE